MVSVRRIVTAAAGGAILLAGIGAGWLLVAPPALLSVGSGYAAKIVCSNLFLAGRDPQAVLADDVQAPGHPLLRLMRVSADRQGRTVTAGLLGVIAPSKAVYREGLGCSLLPEGKAPTVLSIGGPAEAVPDDGSRWPDGEAVDAADPRIAALVSDPALAGPGLRAIVVVRDGRIVAERYGAGFTPETPLLGWSMTKTVNAAILGRALAAGKLGLDDGDLLPQWHGDARGGIRLRHLLAMASGLRFEEDYGSVNDVTRMLYLQDDMAGFAAASPLEAEPGTRFRYSSGTAVLLARIWMNAVGGGQAALDYPRQALFSPLGMRSATLEPDAAGTFVGGSYMYASARDWARFAQFLLQDGVWKGERLLPAEFSAMIRHPSRVSEGRYTEAQAWHMAPRDMGAAKRLPEDTFWILGHDGQAIAVIPSARLIVLRLGLTPSGLGYRPQPLVEAILNGET